VFRFADKVNQKKAVFIDRDGVLVRSDCIAGKPFAVRNLARFRLLPGVVDAHAALQSSGYLTVIVTNQPDLAKGLLAQETLDAMHARLTSRLSPSAIEYCPHSQDDGCDCRKPRPGLFIRAAKRLNIDLGSSFVIGDRKSDIDAGRAVGCLGFFIDRLYHEAGPADHEIVGRFPHFPAAVAALLNGLAAGAASTKG
jgi:D-glycero-D-manno-heptose 1,7-bisphosphate phosphatase